MAAPDIHGTTSDRFAAVRDAFAANFRKGELGAGLCVWHRGERVVDLWGGTTARGGDPWQPDTMTTVFSCTKGVVALAFLMLSDRGEFDYDAPVAEYWPEFGAGGKADITVRTLLNHRAGLLTIDEPITLDMIENDPDRVDGLCAAQEPMWAPGEHQGYHGVTYGLFTQALFRRIASGTLGQFIAAEIAGPLEADFYLGLPEALEPRVATNYPVRGRERITKVIPKLLFHRGTEGRVYRGVAFGGDAARAFSNPRELGVRGIERFNSRQVHALELPWGNGIASARGLCRIYEPLAAGGSLGGVELVAEVAIEPLFPRQSWSERDRVLGKPVGWSQGFLKEGETLFSRNPQSFGHAGAGGSLGWCDPIAQLSIGYAMNQMDHHVRSPRALRLCHAVYDCL